MALSTTSLFTVTSTDLNPSPPLKSRKEDTMRMEATIKVLVEAEDEAHAMDCLSEALRPMLQIYAPQSSVIDWLYVSVPTKPLTPQEYEYQ